MVAMSYKNSVIYFNDVVIWNEHIPREWPFTRKARMIRNQIKLRDISSHILDDLNLNIRRREKLKVTQTTLYLLKMALTKSASDSLRDIFILWMYTHTHTSSHKHREICNHVSWKGKNIKKFNLQQKLKKNHKRYSSRNIFWRRRWQSAVS